MTDESREKSWSDTRDVTVRRYLDEVSESD